MAPNPKQNKVLTFEELQSLRRKVIETYEVRTGIRKFEPPKYKQSPEYELLRDDIDKVKEKGEVPSTGFLCSFFNNDTKLTFQFSTLNYLNLYISSMRPSLPIMDGDRRKTLENNIENKLLKCYQEMAAIAISRLDDFELSHETLTHTDIEVLEKLRPLYECLSDIRWADIKNRMIKNKYIVRGLKVKTPFENFIVGFYIVYPITKGCKGGIDFGDIKKSDQFNLNHIAINYDEASAVYISLVYALDLYSRAILLLKLLDELNGIIKEYPNITHFYTRPVSHDGLRNTLKHGFTKMDESNIFKLDVTNRFL